MTFGALTFLFGIGLLAFSGSEVQALTNAEFFNLVKPYVSDLQISEEKIDDGNDDVIELPGGPDDELDVMNLFQSLGLQEQPDNDTLKAEESNQDALDLFQHLVDRQQGEVGCRRHRHWHWHWHRHRHCRRHRHRHRHRHHRHWVYRRNWCVHRYIRIHLHYHYVHFRISPCLYMVYYPRRWTYYVRLYINGHYIVHFQINLWRLRTPTYRCYSVPYIGRYAKLCVRLYGICRYYRRFCVQFTFRFHQWGRNYHYHIYSTCFRPRAGQLNLLSDPNLDELDSASDDSADNEVGSDDNKAYDGGDAESEKGEDDDYDWMKDVPELSDDA